MGNMLVASVLCSAYTWSQYLELLGVSLRQSENMIVIASSAGLQPSLNHPVQSRRAQYGMQLSDVVLENLDQEKKDIEMYGSHDVQNPGTCTRNDLLSRLVTISAQKQRCNISLSRISFSRGSIYRSGMRLQKVNSFLLLTVHSIHSFDIQNRVCSFPFLSPVAYVFLSLSLESSLFESSRR